MEFPTMNVRMIRSVHSFELKISRPDRMNGLGWSIGQELKDHLEQLQQELQQSSTSPQLLLITAESVQRKNGETVWIAGGDLKEIATLDTPTKGDEYSQLYRHICQLLEQLPIPVLAAIDGQAIGGGIELALAADVRLATRTSSFAFKQVEMGLATGYGGCQRLIEAVGLSCASYWLLSCQQIDAKQALAAGLIHELLDDSTRLRSRCHEFAEQLARLDRQALSKQKQMLRQIWQGSRQAALDQERQLFKELWMATGHRRSLERFQLRR